MANTVACFVMLAIVVQMRCSDDLANTVSIVGATVTMRCKTTSGNCSGIKWSIGSDLRVIYTDGGFQGDYGSRYSVDATSGCHLKIRNVQLTDAEVLQCKNEVLQSAQSAQLIVLDSQPRCLALASPETTEEGDRVILRCEVTFNGTNNVDMTWNKLPYVPPSTKTGRTVRLSHGVTAERPMVPSYECVALFEIVTEGTNLVSNIPTASCNTQRVKILYDVRSAELTPSQPIHFPGSVVTCSSDGNPPPTFKWQESGMENGSWKDVADVTGPEFTTGKETSYYYRCVASNVVKNINYNATSSIFTVKSPITATTVRTEPEMSAGFPLILVVGISISCCVLLLSIVVINICCCVRKCPCYHCCSSQKSSKNLAGYSKEIYARSTHEYDTIEVQEYDYLDLEEEANTAVPNQCAPPDATYSGLQKQEGDLPYYTSVIAG